MLGHVVYLQTKSTSFIGYSITAVRHSGDGCRLLRRSVARPATPGTQRVARLHWIAPDRHAVGVVVLETIAQSYISGLFADAT